MAQLLCFRLVVFVSSLSEKSMGFNYASERDYGTQKKYIDEDSIYSIHASVGVDI